jgi:hypothetical protein
VHPPHPGTRISDYPPRVPLSGVGCAVRPSAKRSTTRRSCTSASKTPALSQRVSADRRRFKGAGRVASAANARRSAPANASRCTCGATGMCVVAPPRSSEPGTGRPAPFLRPSRHSGKGCVRHTTLTKALKLITGSRDPLRREALLRYQCASMSARRSPRSSLLSSISAALDTRRFRVIRRGATRISWVWTVSALAMAK